MILSLKNVSRLKHPELFTEGKITFILDSSAGSSGKGRLASFVVQNNKIDFLINTFMPQASHWVYQRDGFAMCYKQLNSGAHHFDNYEKMYIAQGSVIDLEALKKEIKQLNLPKEKLGIDPLVSILQPIDEAYEKGLVDFEGLVDIRHDGTIKTGTTASGVGAARARKILRRPNVLLARDVEELKPYICNVAEEVSQRLDEGQIGLCEVAQGFQLSLGLDQFYPNTTSRNVTVSAALDDMMLPPFYAGPVILNFRTYPIRISSKKYIGEDGKHLTWEEVKNGVPHSVVDSYSGIGYPDQIEISWDVLTADSKAPHDLTELTSLTKLPRRVFTQSTLNVIDSIRYNRTNYPTFISINFVNYIDWSMHEATSVKDLTQDFWDHYVHYFAPAFGFTAPNHKVSLWSVGTSKYSEDTVVFKETMVLTADFWRAQQLRKHMSFADRLKVFNALSAETALIENV